MLGSSNKIQREKGGEALKQQLADHFKLKETIEKEIFEESLQGIKQTLEFMSNSIRWQDNGAVLTFYALSMNSLMYSKDQQVEIFTSAFHDSLEKVIDYRD